MNKKVIITEPGQISPKDKEKLYKGGYLVIEAKDPSKVRVLSEADVDANTLAMSALKGLLGTMSDRPREIFTNELYKRLSEKEKGE